MKARDLIIKRRESGSLWRESDSSRGSFSDFAFNLSSPFVAEETVPRGEFQFHTFQ